MLILPAFQIDKIIYTKYLTVETDTTEKLMRIVILIIPHSLCRYINSNSGQPSLLLVDLLGRMLSTGRY